MKDAELSMRPGIAVRFVAPMMMACGALVAAGDVATIADPDGCWADDLADGRLSVEIAAGGVYYVDLLDVAAA